MGTAAPALELMAKRGLRLAIMLLVLIVLAACGSSSSYHSSNPVSVTVKKGDTVYAISRRWGTTPREIIDANRLKPPYRIYAGQKLRLPAPKAHVVRKDQTLYGISRAYGVSVSALARANNLRSPYTLQIGQKLRIPIAGSSAPPRKSASTATKRKPVAKSTSASRSATPKPRPLPQTPPKRMGTGFDWPVSGKLISSYGSKGGGLQNDGINISVPRNTPVKAAQSGVIVYAGSQLEGYGRLVLVRHAGGWTTAYAHNDVLKVKRGDKVRRGQTIALSGATGGVTSPQVHFEMRKGTKAVNPLSYLPRR